MLHRVAICAFVIAALLAFGCARHVDPTHELHTQVAPFTQTRDQTVALIKTSKHSMDAPSLNQLAVSYSALEANANGYAGFLVESASISSFDTNKNNDYSDKFKSAINTFNASFAAISPTQASTAKISTTWVPTFADSVKRYWDRYHSALAKASSQQKTLLIEQLKTDTIWPNFEDIATEQAVPPSPR